MHEACWKGKAKGQSSKPIQCTWINLSRSFTKILGTQFSYHKQLDEESELLPGNWYYRLSKFTEYLETKMAFTGRLNSSTLFKSLIASKPVHIVTMKNMLLQFFRRLANILHKEFREVTESETFNINW